MDQTLYYKIAEQVESQIQEGLFKVGSKIPSVRKASSMMDVSMATVLQAYRLLEDRGVLKAQPQKGYFVQALPPTPDAKTVSADITSQQQPAWMQTMASATNNPELLQLAGATPHSQCLPTRQLQRAVGRVMRLEPEACSHHFYDQGLPALRRQIAIRMLATGCQLTPDDIFITHGCQNAILLALQAVTQAGDKVVIESPTYDGLQHIVQALNLTAFELPCTSQGLDLDALATLCQQHDIKACVVTPEHQNPTGASMPLAQRQRLLALAQQQSFQVIEDDVFGELGHPAHTRLPALKALDTAGCVSYCSSFSKTIAPAFRVGWVISPADQIAAIQAYAYAHSFAVAALPQHAIANFLANDSYERHLRKTRAFYADNLAQFSAAIRRYFPSTTELSSPQGGYLIWITLPCNINALEFFNRALEWAINVLPGCALSPSTQPNHTLRINCSTPWSAATEQAIKQLGQLCYEMLD
ncbi:PLP-dependent aminotransferase family protein [Marinomonas ostreistagni]|uniref:aminotransferase-like domain-containing protein n=1 Tax=Marinomonas ostreistagni TaxID=359209 RepID=UPI0019520905|nr:PLP-dependent aminotransferase family protein [Marinomonas ostreistagni]MBM6552176.1 PLP-dependent aminotransferase family protein [Marinomonas ostreistagni]